MIKINSDGVKPKSRVIDHLDRMMYLTIFEKGEGELISRRRTPNILFRRKKIDLIFGS
jgi:hypothetical protein